LIAVRSFFENFGPTTRLPVDIAHLVYSDFVRNEVDGQSGHRVDWNYTIQPK
jgi:hypothetical protein